MEVLINIPQKAYEQIVGFPQQTAGVDILILHKILQEGKVLPKGHGRLIDADELIKDFKLSRAMSVDERLKAACIVNHAYDKRCLVEADKEVDE